MTPRVPVFRSKAVAGSPPASVKLRSTELLRCCSETQILLRIADAVSQHNRSPPAAWPGLASNRPSTSFPRPVSAHPREITFN